MDVGNSTKNDDKTMAYSYLYNYLEWLNNQTGKNFRNNPDLEIKTENLAQNINRLGEVAFVSIN